MLKLHKTEVNDSQYIPNSYQFLVEYFLLTPDS